jgi:hypothetical protein
MRRHAFWPGLLALFAGLLLAVGQHAAGAQSGPAPMATGIQGVVRYEHVPVTRGGLRFDRIALRFVVGALVRVLGGEGQILGETRTDARGRYQLALPAGTAARVYVLAESENARVVVVGSGIEYGLQSDPVVVRGDAPTQVDLRALDANRGSGPFSILDAISRSNALLRSADPSIDEWLPEVTVRWATDYDGGSYFVREKSEAFINGKRATNSDEFDWAVVTHEYGHYVMASYSRDDSPGGRHNLGDVVDPRLAWSEGWASFFGLASLNGPRDAEAVYVDSARDDGSNHGILFWFDSEENVSPFEDVPGYWAELCVASTLWDIYDDHNDPSDRLSLGFTPIWLVLSGTGDTGGMGNATYRYLIDFCDFFVRENPLVANRLKTILDARRITYRPREKPSVPNPWPALAANGSIITGKVDSATESRVNLLASAHYYQIHLPSDGTASLRLEVTGAVGAHPADLALDLLDLRGEVVLTADEAGGVGSQETIAKGFHIGTYVVRVRSYAWKRNDAGEVVPVYNAGRYRLVMRYSGIYDIGTREDDGSIRPVGMNTAGEVVGYGRLGGFFWSDSNHNGRFDPAELKWLPKPDTADGCGARAINDSGQICGVLGGRIDDTHRYAHPCIWDGDTIVDLGTAGPPDYDRADAVGINSKGEVAGTTATRTRAPNGESYLAFAYRWSKGRRTLLRGGRYGTTAIGIADDGTVAGTSSNDAAEGGTQATVWKGGSPTLLGMLPGDDRSYGMGISRDGRVACLSLPSGRAFTWKDGTRYVLPRPGGYSIAGYPIGINSKGEITATVHGVDGYWAWVWNGRKWIDLTRYAEGSGWLFGLWSLINENGQVAGVGGHDYWTHGFLIDPTWTRP